MCPDGNAIEIAIVLTPQPILMQPAPGELVEIVDVLVVTPSDKVLKPESVRVERRLSQSVFAMLQVQFHSFLRFEGFEC